MLKQLLCCGLLSAEADIFSVRSVVNLQQQKQTVQRNGFELANPGLVTEEAIK